MNARDNKVFFVYGYDWEGMYVDGKLVLEGHTLEIEEVLNKLQQAAGYVSIDYGSEMINGDWLVKRGSLPEDINELPESD